MAEGMANRFDGLAENVLMARDVSGGVHIHQYAQALTRPRQLPPPVRYFTNQVRVLAQMDEALSPHGDRPVSIVLLGPPGSGKAETARHWLDRHQEQFPDGMFYADLGSGVDDGALVSARLRDFLLVAGVAPAVIPDSLEGRSGLFRSWSAGKRVAVLVENAWAPEQVRSLAPGPARSVVIATAAGPLGGLGADGAYFIDLEPFEDDAAEEFLGRLVGRERLAAEPEAVREVLGCCAGLPIALHVVGSHLVTYRSRRLSRLVEELRDENRRLRAMSREEHTSVVAVFSTAYQRLSTTAQRCYRLLGVHPGEADVGVDVLRHAVTWEESALREALDELVSVSLVREVVDDRYLLHPLVRLHARGLASESGTRSEHDGAMVRMLEFYRHGSIVAGNAVMPLRGWDEALFSDELAAGDHPAAGRPWEWLEAERGNLRATVETAYRRGGFSMVCQMCVALWPLHEQGKYFEDLITVNELGITAARELGSPAFEALLRVQLGFPHLARGDADRAYAIFAEAREPARKAGIAALRATVLEAMGLARLGQDRVEDARELLRQNLALAKEIGPARRVAVARMLLARAQPPDIAVPQLIDAAEGFGSLDPPDTYNLGKATLWRGKKLTDASQFDAAGRCLADAETELDKPFDRVQVLVAFGDLAYAQGDATAAAARYREALALAESHAFTIEAGRLKATLARMAGSGDGADLTPDVPAEGD